MTVEGMLLEPQYAIVNLPPGTAAQIVTLLISNGFPQVNLVMSVSDACNRCHRQLDNGDTVTDPHLEGHGLPQTPRTRETSPDMVASAALIHSLSRSPPHTMDAMVDHHGLVPPTSYTKTKNKFQSEATAPDDQGFLAPPLFLEKPIKLEPVDDEQIPSGEPVKIKKMKLDEKRKRSRENGEERETKKEETFSSRDPMACVSVEKANKIILKLFKKDETPKSNNGGESKEKGESRKRVSNAPPGTSTMLTQKPKQFVDVKKERLPSVFEEVTGEVITTAAGTNLKLMKCERCDRNLRVSAWMDAARHVLSHGEGAWRCGGCDKEYKIMATLRKHYRDTHQGPLVCHNLRDTDRISGWMKLADECFPSYAKRLLPVFEKGSL